MKKLKLAVFCASALVGLTAIVASAAQPDPYVSGTTGYDVSWPNSCSATVSGSAFGIVGVNGGRPFTTNACFGPQYAAAPAGATSVYLNTAYSGAYKKNIDTVNCAKAPAGLTGSYAQAWQIGCSEASSSYAAVGNTRTPVMWWLDVETGNSWSSSNFTLNADAIRGAADELHSLTGRAVGIYSTPGSWSTITRNANFSSIVDGEWDAGTGACATTATTGFTGVRIWLKQTGTDQTTGLDTDSACTSS